MRNPLEQYTEFYHQGLTVPDAVRFVISQIGEPRLWLKTINRLFSESNQTPSMLSSLAQNLESIIDAAFEQIAATALADNFGVPESLLAVPVAINLAELEQKWHQKLADKIAKTEDVMKALIEYINVILITTVTELVKVEAEIEQYQQTQANNQVNHGQTNVVDIRSIFNQKLTQKIDQLRVKQNTLKQRFASLMQYVNQNLSINLRGLDSGLKNRTQIFASVGSD